MATTQAPTSDESDTEIRIVGVSPDDLSTLQKAAVGTAIGDVLTENYGITFDRIEVEGEGTPE